VGRNDDQSLHHAASGILSCFVPASMARFLSGNDKTANIDSKHFASTEGSLGLLLWAGDLPPLEVRN
jgi:hypothetical protein